MGVAQCVTPGQFQVGSQSIMHAATGVPRQQPNCLDRGRAPLEMPGVVRQSFAAHDVQPMQAAADSQPGLIDRHNLGLAHRITSFCTQRPKRLCRLSASASSGALCAILGKWQLRPKTIPVIIPASVFKWRATRSGPGAQSGGVAEALVLWHDTRDGCRSWWALFLWKETKLT